MARKILFLLLFTFLASTAFAQLPPTGIQDEGGSESKPVFTIDCVGAGITCTHSGSTATITVSGGSGGTTASGTMTYVTDTTDNFAIEGTDSSAPFYYEASTNTTKSEGGFICGDGTDATRTCLTNNRASTNATIQFNEITNEWESNFPMTFTGTANALTFSNGESITNIPDGFLTMTGTIRLSDYTTPVILSTDSSGNVTGTTIVECVTFRAGQFSTTGTIATIGDATAGADPDGSNSQKLIFNETTDNGAGIEWQLPNHWSSHGTPRLGYSMATATSGTVEWELGVMCQSSGDAESVDADGFAGLAVSSETVGAVATRPDEVTFTVTDDSCAANDRIVFFVSTDADDGSADTATGDRRLHYLTYCYSR